MCVEFLQDYRSRPLNSYDRKFLETAVQVWRFYSVQKYILKIINSASTENGSGFIMHARAYSDNPSNQFLPSFSRIMSKGYKPTMEDILTVRIPTICKNVAGLNSYCEKTYKYEIKSKWWIYVWLYSSFVSL